MKYYRLAFRERPSSLLVWKSPALVSLDELLQHLISIRHLLPLERIRVVTAS